MLRSVLIAVVLLASGSGSPPSQAAPAATSWILYASDWSGRMQIYALDPARPAVTRQVTFGGDGFLDPHPSPDGRRLAYLGSSTSLWEGSRDLWVARANGAAPRRVAAGSVTGVVWSPDSRQLAYVLGEKLHLVRADGSGDRGLTRFR
jgi:Tol biopolymer transport system component